ncbi:MAG: CRISPR-associated protein Cas10/Csm1 [Syntrophomonadaceae bacterium]|nr:CRISPR-associated protein Cas10/Csm1 [Bacillota bacterium]
MPPETNEINTLRIAALLHDIGKFWQGAGKSGSHSELSRVFIEAYVPERWHGAGLASAHHKPEMYTSKGYKQLKIIALADWLSSGERRELEKEEETGKRKTTPLMSIFSKIDIGKGELPPEHYYPIKQLALRRDTIFPVEGTPSKDLTNDYEELWGEFVDEVEKIKDVENFESYFNTLYYLLQKYTWCVPSAVWKSEPDISLFDHLKTTCAIVSCLHDADEEYLDNVITALSKRYNIKKELEKKDIKGDELNKKLEERQNAEAEDKDKEAHEEERFLLIGGDISGIQKFIYSITSKGAAKGLRGRSLYLQLLTETIAHFILDEIRLPVANLLYCGGGHFYILAPKGIEKSLTDVQKTITEKLLDIHRGDLYLAIGWVKLSSSDFSPAKFSKKWDEVGKELAEKKKHKFGEILDEKHHENIFGPIDEGGTKDTCDVCGVEAELVTDKDAPDVKKCHFCSSVEKLAKDIADKEYVVKILGAKEKSDAKVGDWKRAFGRFETRYEFKRELDSSIKDMEADSITIYRLNSTDLLSDLDIIKDAKSPMSFGFSFLVNTHPKEFNELAEASEGLDKWAVLRMDVDDLGKIFSQGLGDDRTISRISTLSSMLSLYFSGWIDKICDEHKDNVYGIYSGGDDLFMVGSWSTMPNIAEQIYNEFREYTCQNPNITLSAGVSIAPGKKYPIHKAADLAGDALNNKSKSVDGKDAITFLDMAMKWETFKSKVVDIKKTLLNLLSKDIHRALLQKLYSVHAEYCKQRKKHGRTHAMYDGRYTRWRWLLAYVITRMKGKDKEINESLEEVKKLVCENIEHTPVAVRWVEFSTRKKGDEKAT